MNNERFPKERPAFRLEMWGDARQRNGETKSPSRPTCGVPKYICVDINIGECDGDECFRNADECE